MKKGQNVLYIVDDYIFYYVKNTKQIIKEKINNKALKNGKIANVKLFVSSFKKLLSKHKLNNNLFGDTLTIIVNPSFTKVDIEVVTNVFTSLNYRNVKIINELKLYKLNNSNAYLNYNDNYYIFTYIDYFHEKQMYFIESNLMDTQSLIKFIKNKIKKRNIFVFGLNKDIENIITLGEEKTNNNWYHFTNDETYLLDIYQISIAKKK